MSLPGTDRDRGRVLARHHPWPPGVDRAAVRRRDGVKLLAMDGERVLLVKETRTDGPDFWTLPGGGLHRSESPMAGLEREIAEELGGSVDVDRVIGQCSYHHTSRPDTVSVYTVYGGTVRGDIQPNSAEGVVDYRWTVPPVPEDTLRPFRNVIRQHVPAARPSGP